MTNATVKLYVCTLIVTVLSMALIHSSRTPTNAVDFSHDSEAAVFVLGGGR